MVMNKRAHCSVHPKALNSRAQFFLLAAVIIVAVVISLGITANQATVTREPGGFYDFSYEVSREVGAVMDYSIYSDFDEDVNLTKFVDLLAADIKDKDPDVNFVIVYGDSVSGVEVMNEEEDSIIVNEDEVRGKEKIVVSRICHGQSCQDIESVIGDFDSDIGRLTIDADKLEGEDNIQIDVGKQIVEFPISKHGKVLFIMRKDVGDESFVAIE